MPQVETRAQRRQYETETGCRSGWESNTDTLLTCPDRQAHQPADPPVMGLPDEHLEV
jgi:hypothetical protein